MDDWLDLLSTPLPTADAVGSVSHPDAGGMAVFLGTTRAERHRDSGHPLVALDYEAYADLATKQLQELAARAKQQWPILRLAVLHRVGRVEVGQASVLVAVATPHRAEAFDACRWLIDTLKVEVAVWKKEVWSDGTQTWVDPRPG
jgi:molybdopterin synthase catalytic subunit